MLAIDDGNGCAPIPLSGNQPVTQAVVDFKPARVLFLEVGQNPLSRLFGGKSVKVSARDEYAVLTEGQGIGAFGFGGVRGNAGFRDDAGDGEIVFFRKRKVPLIVRGHAHDGARAVGAEHIVCNPNGHFFSVDGIDGVTARKAPCLFPGSGHAVDFGSLGALGDIGVDLGGMFGRGELRDERMLGREYDIGDPEEGIGAGGEHAEGLSVLELKLDLAAHGLTDPILLHELGLFRPIQLVEPGEKFLGVLGDAEEPLRQILADDGRAAPLAGSVPEHLLVGEHGVAGGAPVDGRLLAVGEPVFIEL